MANFLRLNLFLMLIALSPCYALSEDRSQTMLFSADAAELNQQSHRGTYIGHVKLDQGSTHIRASHVITEGNLKNQLIKAVLKGNQDAQAHYWTLPAANKPMVHAYADTIYYYPHKHLIELIGHARVEQGNDSFSAPEIKYDTMKQHVISDSSGNERTTIIIHPGKTP